MVSVIHRINAAFGVSKAFVPYRPNYDLVCDNLTRYKWDQDTTIGTDWTLTGIVLEAPVNAFVKLDAAHFWAASAPRGLRITRSNTSASTDVVASVENETDQSQLTTSAFGIKNYGVNTYYVWAKAKVAGKNYIALAYSILLKD